MDAVMHYEDDRMDVGEDGTALISVPTGENPPPIKQLFRTKSLFFATFPWLTAIPLTESRLVEQLGDHPESHYAFHLANSLDNYDFHLKSENIHHSPLKALLREKDSDTMSDMSTVAISNRETSLLKSRERANEFCSFICAYRLLDVVICCAGVFDNPTISPKHKQMGINGARNERGLRRFEDWTIILHKFRQNVNNSTAKPAMNVDNSDLPAHQLNALFRLHSNMNVSKSLVNMQLAATHITFMVQQQSKDLTIPDFPGSLLEFKNFVLRALPSQNDSFMAFLEGFAGGKDNVDSLRLPLQVALLISPIFLLQDAQIHLSNFYVQRHKMILYSKALGNDRPGIVSEIEGIIWQEVIEIAKGTQTVEEAASNIASRVPEIYDHLHIDLRRWFMLTPITKKDEFLNLTSFSIQTESVPKNWPFATVLQSGKSLSQSRLQIEDGSRVQEDVPGLSALIPKMKKRRIASTLSRKMQTNHTKSSAAQTKAPSRYSIRRHQAVIGEKQNLPLVIGKRYLKVENIDLEELSMLKLCSTEYVPLSESISNLSKFSAYFHTLDIHGGRLEHTFTTPFEKVHTAVIKFLEKIQGNFTFRDRIPSTECKQISAIKGIDFETSHQMSPQSFQEELRSKHIVIADYILPHISCDRRGLTSLNSLKEVVNIEDQSTSDTPQVKNGNLNQFVDNLELNNPNILRLIRMRSYSGVESFQFSSDHVAWRETVTNPYCNYDSLEDASLRWTDVSTKNAIQFWKIAPAGFGIFFDVRSGCQLVILATIECTGDVEDDKDFFTQWGRYLQDFNHMDPELFSENNFEAIRLEPGNRLVLRPNTPYVVISLEDTVITGGFYLSSRTLFESLIGQIHSFILPSLLTEGKKPPVTTFIRRIVHYMHNAYVVNDSSDRSHLLSFSTFDDVRDLFALVTMAIFLNVLDERTYQLSLEAYQEELNILQMCHNIFDLNAIPVIERHHLCYTRGLSIDLLEWFFENYSISSVELEENDVDAFPTVFVPFIVHIGRQITKYKRAAEERGVVTSSTFKQVNCQVQSALFAIDSMRDGWLEEKAAEQEQEYCLDLADDESVDLDALNLDYDLSGYVVSRREVPTERKSNGNFIENGKSDADKRFFRGLTSEFKLDDLGSENDSSDYFSS